MNRVRHFPSYVRRGIVRLTFIHTFIDRAFSRFAITRTGSEAREYIAGDFLSWLW